MMMRHRQEAQIIHTRRLITHAIGVSDYQLMEIIQRGPAAQHTGD